MLTSIGFDDLIVACNLLCSMDVLFECRRTILWAMLCIVSWSQGLVMAKDPCEATITKRLAWLVEQLVVSSHEFSFVLFWKLFSNSFIIFSINVFTTFLVHYCSIFILFPKPLLFCFHIVFHRLSTYHMLDFLFFPFSNSFKQTRLVNITRERTVNASIASRPCGFDPLSQCYNGSIEGTCAHTSFSLIS